MFPPWWICGTLATWEAARPDGFLPMRSINSCWLSPISTGGPWLKPGTMDNSWGMPMPGLVPMRPVPASAMTREWSAWCWFVLSFVGRELGGTSWSWRKSF